MANALLYVFFFAVFFVGGMWLLALAFGDRGDHQLPKWAGAVFIVVLIAVSGVSSYAMVNGVKDPCGQDERRCD